MFRTDEMTVKQRMEDIRSDVEASRMKSRPQKEESERKNPIWIVLVTLFQK